MSNINFENYFHEMVEDLQNLIRIPTLYDEASRSAAMPYGKNLDAGLAYMKQLAVRDGFEVREYDGHALAIIGNNNTERVDVVSHLDVVEPASVGMMILSAERSKTENSTVAERKT